MADSSGSLRFRRCGVAGRRAGLEDVEKLLTGIITRSSPARRFGVRWALLGRNRVCELTGHRIHEYLVVTLAVGDNCSAPPADLSESCLAVGLLLQEGGVPVRLRSCWLDDLDLAELARRAEDLRGTTRLETPTLWLLDGTG